MARDDAASLIRDAGDLLDSRELTLSKRSVHIWSVWEVAAMVRTLVGPYGRCIIGQTIHVDGGGYMP